MGDKTSIEWTDATWNPVTGCTKVSQGCKHCYAERVFPRAYGKQLIETDTKPVIGAMTMSTIRRREFTDVLCHPERLEQPLHWRKPRRIFVNSMSDLFHESVPDEFIMAVVGTIVVSPYHTFQILTKRPQRMRDFFLKLNERGNAAKHCIFHLLQYNVNARICDANYRHWPLPTLQLLVSCEDQTTANERITQLFQTPAALRGVSLEPLLGPIDLTHLPVPREVIDESFGERGGDFVFNALTDRDDDHFFNCHPKLDWVIAGGESGPNARPSHPDWFRSLRDQCQAAGVPFFFKQWGEWAPWPTAGDDPHPKGTTCHALPDGTVTDTHWNGGAGPHLINSQPMVRFGKKKAGAKLDGREWREFPT